MACRDNNAPIPGSEMNATENDCVIYRPDTLCVSRQGQSEESRTALPRQFVMPKAVKDAIQQGQ